MRNTKKTVLLFTMIFMAAGVSADNAVMVRNGQFKTTLIVTEQLRAEEGPHAERPERRREPALHFADLAVDEIKEHLALLGDGDIEVLHVPAAKAAEYAAGKVEDGRAAIVLGGPELDRALYESVLETGDDPDAFALRVADGIVTVLGPTPKAVLNGVYEMLEQLGFRWYKPGDFGRVTPKGDTHVLPARQTVQSPSFRFRYRLNPGRGALGEATLRWSYRMRHNDIGRISAGHGISGITRSTREEHPEWFALLDGKRSGRGQVCVSNPDLLEFIVNYNREQFRENPDRRVLTISPYDGFNYCECPDCQALDPSTHVGGLGGGEITTSMTDRYIWLINQALDRLVDEFQDIKVPFMPYAGVMDPPVRYKPDLRAEWYSAIANIHECRIHGPGNPNCPETRYTIWLAKQWNAMGMLTTISGYHENLACPAFPFIMIGRIRDEAPIFHELGAHGVGRVGSLQVSGRWGSIGPSHHLAAKLAWNVDTDVDALLAEFFEKFYGPAAKPMKEYTMLMDRALYEADYHTGSGWDLIHIYDDAVRKQARSALRKAERLAGLRPGPLGRRLISADRLSGDNALYALRVEVASKCWRFFDEAADMMESRRHHDFAASMAALERAHAIADSLLEDYEYEMIRPGARIGCKYYLDLFLGNITRSGHECLSDGGELIAGLNPKWEFMLDPQGIGERIGLYDPFYTGGNWQAIDTHHSWGTQGLRYYYSQAWYRQRVKIPADAAGKKIHLWFGGVDRGARVWVNGQMLGTSPGTEFDINAFGGITRPFEFDATAAVRPGAENLVVVRVIRDICNELGTGGLRDVAMFYAPAEQERQW